MAHGDITRMDWRVRYLSPARLEGGYPPQSQWFQTEERARLWIVGNPHNQIVSVAQELHILDF